MNILHKFRTDDRASASSSTAAATVEPSEAAPRILLVGEEFAWLPEGAILAGRNVVHTTNKEDAAALLALESFDGLIAGLPEIDGNLSLLDIAWRTQPAPACGLRANAAKVAHLVLPHPIIPATQSIDVLDDLVRTMFATARWNADPAFVCLKAQVRKIPALSTLYTQITAVLQKEHSSLQDLADLIACEPAVSVRILQAVNSAAFVLRQPVTSIRDASNFLGVQRLHAIVLSTSLMSQCDVSRCRLFIPEIFEKRSLQIANWSARIAIGETRDRRLGELAFTAGLLHQFGALLLAANLPESYSEVLRLAASQNVSVASAERQTYGVTQAELAAFLLASWNIPFAIVNAVGFHAQPSSSEEDTFSPLTAVHLATAIDNQIATGVGDFDRAYLGRLHLLPRLDHWTRTLTEGA